MKYCFSRNRLCSHLQGRDKSCTTCTKKAKREEYPNPPGVKEIVVAKLGKKPSLDDYDGNNQ